jgi:hypothetical protein
MATMTKKNFWAAWFSPWQVKIPLHLAAVALAVLLLFLAERHSEKSASIPLTQKENPQSYQEEAVDSKDSATRASTQTTTPEPPAPPIPRELGARSESLSARALKEPPATQTDTSESAPTISGPVAMIENKNTAAADTPTTLRKSKVFTPSQDSTLQGLGFRRGFKGADAFYTLTTLNSKSDLALEMLKTLGLENRSAIQARPATDSVEIEIR